MRNRLGWLVLSIAVLLGGWGFSRAAEDDAAAQQEQRDQAAAERFRTVLEGNPRRGTALDRLYGYHIERGTLDDFINQYKSRADKDAADGVAWMVVGLLESQRGQDAAAVAAYTEAETRLPDSAMPAYYLGQSLVLVGQPDAAAEAFERALTRKPNRTDLLDIFQALGRVYQRGQRPEKALAVWARLEQLFPDDMRVQEQIASTLIEEGQHEQALPRLDKLAQQTQDPYRKSTLRMDAAELKVKLKRTNDALADFEGLLAELNPDSWLYRDVRRRIEEVFLRNDDTAGLAKYYEQWVEKHPKDIDGVSRLARTLYMQSRLPEAASWLQKGIEIAPNNKALHQALIEQLVYEQKYADAAKEYEALDKIDSTNPDVLREWGKLLLRDTSQPEADRKAAAVAVWKRMLERKPDDPVTAAQVADLVRTANLTDEAIALYKKAIELSPISAQYREYLGEYLHSQNRSEEALATWRPIAEGENRNAKNLTRLAEVFAGFGYQKEALATLAEAIELDKDNFTLLLTYANLLQQNGRHDDALAQLDAAEKLVGNSTDDAESVLLARVNIFQATDSLGAQCEELQKQLDAGTNVTAERWHRLARYYDAARQPSEATASIIKAVQLEPKSVPLLASAARIHESGGNLLAAADTYRNLAAVDRRFRTEHLTAVARLEQRLGRKDQALQAGRDLLAAAPGNPDHYKFFAELCFQLGDPEEGLESLRRSVRANPAEPEGLLTLAQALSERARGGEAIELLWRAFEKTDGLDGKLAVIDRLTEAYLQNNQFDRLMERLERERREAEQAREMTLCIAQAYRRAGDLGTARQQLERLLTENTRDATLLKQLSQLAESENDLAAAAKYGRQVVAATPGDYEAQLRLAQLLVRNGEVEEAADIWVKLVSAETEPSRNLQAIDQLAVAKRHDTVLAITARLLAQKPSDWELLYREGASLAALGRIDEATSRFKAILSTRMSDDDESAIVIAQKKKDKKTANSVSAPSPMAMMSMRQMLTAMQMPPLLLRTQNVYELRSYTGLDLDMSYRSSGPPRTWSPRDYGQARMAALAWTLGFAIKAERKDAFLKECRIAKDQAGADPRPVWDWYYLQTARQDFREAFDASVALAGGNDAAAQLALLNALALRGQNYSRMYQYGQNPDRVPPLPPDQIDLMLSAYRKLRQQKPDWATSNIVQNVQAELKRVKRTDDEEAVYQEAVSTSNTIQSAFQAFNTACGRGDVPKIVELFAIVDKLQGAAKRNAAQAVRSEMCTPLCKAMAQRAEEKSFQEVAALLDLYIDNMRRRNQAAPKSLTSSRPQARTAISISIYTSSKARGQRSIQMDYPQPNDYFDETSIQLLRNAYEMFKRGDLSSDLLAHFQKLIEPAPPAERVYYYLALGYLNWWNDEKDEALAQLALAAEQVPQDANLALEVAEMREKNNELDVALAALDAIAPMDHNVMQRRERAALRVAERTGNVERARQAAERLFGLRLDAATQVDLAGRMQRLGMQEMAEAVMGRAQRQVGSRSDALVNLMNQYQNQNQADLAVQTARQILRRGPSMQFSPYGTSEDGVRDQALRVIARSGQLKDMIERTEAQLKTSPKSLQIHLALLDYYRAANDKEKFKSTVERLVTIKPDDGKLRFQLAQQLQAMNERQAAADQYKAVIKLEPMLYANRYSEVTRLFQEMNKTEELIKTIEEADLRSAAGRSYAFIQPVQELFQKDETRQQGLRLFRKVWDAFPEERNFMIRNLYNEATWQLPEVYAYAKQGLLPSGEGMADPWRGVEEIISFGPNGKIIGVISRTLEMARRQNRIRDLEKDTRAALAAHPEWSGGKAILAVIELQTGREEHARAVLEELLADKKTPMTPMVRSILEPEFENYSATRGIGVQMLEGAIDDMFDDTNMEFEYSPMRRLTAVYRSEGRTDDARQLALRCLKRSTIDFDPGYSAYRQIRDHMAIADELLELGSPVDSARILNNILADKETITAADRFGGDRFRQEVEEKLRTAVKRLRPETASASVDGLLTRRGQPELGRGALDLVLVIEPRQFKEATLGSMFDKTFRATEKLPDARKASLAKLAQLSSDCPQDFSVQAAAALAALLNKSSEAPQAVERLVALVELQPLETLAPGKRANARQRAQALDQVALWLVARECLKDDRSRPAGLKLAQRAAAAAKRQPDSLYATAVLREWGQMELDRGDAQAAENCFSQILEMALPPPSAKKPTDSKTSKPVAPPPANGRAAIGEPAAGAVAAFSVPSERPTQVAQAQATPAATGVFFVPAGTAVAASAASPSNPVLTADQFTQAMEIARLVLDKKMTALSLRAVRAALSGGPPMQPTTSNQNRATLVVSSPGVTFAGGPGSIDPNSVLAAVTEIVRQWRGAGVSPAEIYGVLVDIVMPEARPEEVFLYSAANTSGTQRSAGQLLVKAAVDAQRVDDLRERLQARSKKPLGELPAKVLLGHLALETKDTAAASEILKQLAERTKKDTLQASAELIGGVAVVALNNKDLAVAAAPLVETATKNLAAAGRLDLAQGLLLRLARYQRDAKDEVAARQTFAQIVDLPQKYPSRAANSFRTQQASQLTHEFVNMGWAADALAELGKQLDTLRAGDERPIPGLPGIWLGLRTTPAAERYQLWKTWTLPTEARKSVRFVAANMPRFVPPAAFGDFSRPGSPIISSADLLIEAARETGKLDELQAEFDQLANDKVENANLLKIMVAVARGDVASIDADLKELLADIQKRATLRAPPQRANTAFVASGVERPMVGPRLSDYLVANACLADPKGATRGEELMRAHLDHAQKIHMNNFITEARKALSAYDARREGIGDVLETVGLNRWLSTAVGSIWVAQDGHVGHLAADLQSYLCFDCPLGGTFEFSVDAYQGPFAEGHAAYAGILFDANRPGSNSFVASVAGHERIARSLNTSRVDDFNRITLQVEPGKVRCLVNGQLYFEELDPASTSPWLLLECAAIRKTAFRNAALTGKPEVLREVPLSKGDQLSGWMSHVYLSQLPTPLNDREAKLNPANVGQAPLSRSVEESRQDWKSLNGQITGRRNFGDTADPMPSNLVYFRPMQPGDKIRYEFSYAPGEFEVHPSFGRLAFLIEPDGMRLHWMGDSGRTDWTGLPVDNAMIEKDARRGPEKLPLKTGDWNRLQMSLKGDVLTLELNDQLIYERTMEPGGDRVFGLFHYRNLSAALVRNVVLTGDWPQQLKLDDVAIVPPPANAAAEARLRRSMIGEQMYGKGAGLVLDNAMQLSPAQRYQVLADWVLPTAARPLYQMSGRFKPQTAPATQPADSQGRRVLLGCSFDSPALELVSVAKEIGKLDELAERVANVSLPGDAEFDQRYQRAMLVVVRAAQGRDAEAEAPLRQLQEQLKKLPLDADGWQRWPEYVAATAAAQRPALQQAALATFDTIVGGMENSVKQKKNFSDREEWLRVARAARARLQVASLPGAEQCPFGCDPALASWIPVCRVAPDNRELTRGVAHWGLKDGAVWHYPGYQDDNLYLRMPITGDFEVNCDLTASGWREARIQYAGLRFDLDDSRKNCDLFEFGQLLRKIPLDPPLEDPGEWYHYRLVVKDGTCTAFVNDREISAEPLSYSADPWFIVNVPHENTAAVRNFRITGQPTVPERIRLAGGFDLDGWQPFHAGYAWSKLGEEIKSEGKRPELVDGKSPPRRAPERAMHYHRPLLEDGEVEYEFYYEPDKALVHPALDHVAFLLEPDGVRIHRLTTSGYYASDIKFDNVTDEPANRRGPAQLPLREKTWNRARLSVEGDTVKIALNGELVFERPIEPTNLRTFGFFHFGDMTEARVRNVTYAGKWPKQCPAAEELIAAVRKDAP